MANTISNLQGKTVYRNSSYAPTRGTNNAQGYIERELSKRGATLPGQSGQQVQGGNVGTNGGVSSVGSDGQSDTRSGNAQQAINTVKQQGQVGTTASGGNPLITGMPQLNIPEAPVAQISAIGELELPYNFKSTQNLISQRAAAQKALQESQVTAQNDSIKYLRDMVEGQGLFDKLMHTNRNTASGQGTAFSSAHGKAISDGYNEFSNVMQNMAMDYTNTLNSRTANDNSVMQSLNDVILNEILTQGYEAGEKAGEWVIKPTSTPKAKPNK